jgi:hypothetical protein
MLKGLKWTVSALNFGARDTKRDTKLKPSTSRRITPIEILQPTPGSTLNRDGAEDQVHEGGQNG